MKAVAFWPTPKEAEDLKSLQGSFFGLGIILVIVGLISVGSAVFLTLASVVLIGWLMIGGGIVQAVHAFWRERWSGLFLSLFTGILYTVVGFMVVANPTATAVTLTLLIAMFLLFEGLMRMASAIALRLPHWPWILFHGLISLLLGLAIWRGWPLSGLWTIGVFVGVNMILNGVSLIVLGLTSRKLAVDPSPPPSPAS